MESLAFVVVVIFVGVVIALPTIAVGVWLWWVTDTVAARAWASGIMLVGGAALVRTVREG